MRKESLVKSTMLGLGVVGAMLINMTNAMSSYIHEQYDEENGVNTLTICDWYDSSKCITMKDRNEGATKAGTGCSSTDTGACGLHYQWGNNYGFLLNFVANSSVFPNGEVVKNYNVVNVNGNDYEPSTYSGDTFITDSRWGNEGDWSTEKSDNLWGGSGDSPNNDRGLHSENPITDRQGPCGSGYHVPSIGEWTKVLEYWAEENNIILSNSTYSGLDYTSSGLKYTPTSDKIRKFAEDFMIPFASYRQYDAVVYNIGIGGIAGLWSSSSYVDRRPNYLYLLSSAAYTSTHNNFRADALSVRCFKDSAIGLIPSNTVKVKVFIDNNVYEFELIPGSKFSENADLMTILNQDMSKRGWVFLGWYDENGEKIIDFDIQPTISAKIVAKYTYTYEKVVAGINTITICDQDFENCITMKDRNEGATKAGTECSVTDTGACGYHYQWGNNHGFLLNFDGDDSFLGDDTMTTDERVDTFSPITYGPTNYYESNIFRKITSSPWDWSTQGNDNLWGGSGDSKGNNRGLTSTNDITDRQGPCDTGYHIPSIGEWNNVLKYLAARYSSKQFKLYDSNGLKYTYDALGKNLTGVLKIPFAGTRTYSSANISSIGSSTYFWSSSPKVDSNYAYSFYFYGGGLSANKPSVRAYAFSVRCFKDKPLSFPSSVVFKIIDSDEEKNSRVVETQDVLPADVIAWMSEYANTNPGYTLSGWYDDEAESRWTPEMEVETGFTLRAVWTKNQVEEPTSSSNGSHGGGGGSSISKDNCPNGDYSDSYYDGTCGAKPQNDKEVSSGVNEEVVEFSEEISSSEGQGNNELQTAYEFAYKNGITTMDTIEEADMMGNLNRISMAKMLGKYAINVLGKKPANTIVPKFSDVTEELNAEYDYGVTLAYQLGIMGINMPNGKFRPNDPVTRAEFVTALSRLLYNTEDGKILYYSTHMELLNKMGIITVTDPDMKELRGYVMLMLMRSAK